MGMYYPPRRPDEIYHWGIEKGSESKNHKYFNRILTGVKNGQNIYRYFYDKAEWDAYKNNQKQQAQPEPSKPVNQVSAQQTNANVGNVNGRPSLLSRLLFGRLGSELIERGKEAIEKIINPEAAARKENDRKEFEESRKESHDMYKPQDPSQKTISDAEIEKRKAAADSNGGIENPEGEQKYKYVAKIPMGDGTFRYFYDKASLEAYYNAVDDELAKEFGVRTEASTGVEDRVNINERYHDVDEWDAFFNDVGTEYTNNCYSCTTAYELRRRGYDVDAIDDKNGDTWDTIMSMYENPTSKSYSGSSSEDYDTFTDKMLNDMKSEGDGARGNLCVVWSSGSGHSMAWEVVNGEVVIIDNQTDEVYRGDRIKEELFASVDVTRSLDQYYITPPDEDGLMYFDDNHTNPNSKRYYDQVNYDPVQWVRTDNCELNTKNIRKYVRKDY